MKYLICLWLFFLLFFSPILSILIRCYLTLNYPLSSCSPNGKAAPVGNSSRSHFNYSGAYQTNLSCYS